MPSVSAYLVDPAALAEPADTAAAPGFAAALQRQQLARVLSAPTVSLGDMVTALVDGSAAVAGAAHLPGALPGAATIPAGTPGEQAVIAAAERYLGVPYRWGGTDPAKGLDCSGFVQRVYADLGVSLPRVSVDQSKQGIAVPSLEQARPGDLVYWSGSPNHIGIYAGEGRMIVAPRTGDVVRYQTITRTPHAIRRII